MIHQYLAYNREFMAPPAETGSTFVPWIGASLPDILCLQEERIVRAASAAAVISESTGIPPHLSLPSFQIAALIYRMTSDHRSSRQTNDDAHAKEIER